MPNDKMLRSVTGGVTLDTILRAPIRTGIVDAYEKTDSLCTWMIEKYADGTLRMRSNGYIVVSLNYAASGNIFIGGYLLQFPEESLRPCLINCNTLESSGASFYATSTAQDNKTSALVQFSRNAAGQAIRTQHAVEIVGTWK